MNKLFRKIGMALTAMALGLGVSLAIHSSQKELTEVTAAATTETFNVGTIATAKKWENGTAYTNLVENGTGGVSKGESQKMTITGSGSGNNCKYYSSDNSWRFYTSNNGQFTVSLVAGYYITSVALSGTVNVNNPSTTKWELSSGTFTPKSGVKESSIVIANGNSNSKITEIAVSYEAESAGPALYTISYDANVEGYDGATPDQQTQASEGASLTLASALSFPGYTWLGWNTSASGGQATRHAAGSSYTPTANTTMYGEWEQRLDAITAIGGTVVGSVSNQGTTQWDFSSVTVTGTVSGLAGQNVKSMVDLSSSTNIPDTAGSCTVSVTATKKDSVAGDATSFTNASVDGEVEVSKLTYTVTFSYSQLWAKADVDAERVAEISYVNENAHEKTSTATCADHDDYQISWNTNQVMNPSGTSSYMQFQKNTGYLYNTTQFAGIISNVAVNSTEGTFTVFYGNTAHPTSGTTVGGKFFTVQVGNATGKITSVVVTFLVSDKPKVNLDASAMNLDVSDGAATPTITDGSSAVNGCTLISTDPYVASITLDGKVQPVGYGTTTISVSKEEDAGHVYTATSFTVTVGDRSKEVSSKAFSGKANGSATASDGVVWTITAKKDSTGVSENEFSNVYGINFGTNNNKVNSLTLTTPAAADGRIIKNVVIECMSQDSGSTVAVSVGENAFTCSKSASLTASISTYNFSGSAAKATGAITITISGTQSAKYGVKSITVLYVGDAAIEFASTFLGAISCNSLGTSKPSFTIKTGETYWTWALLKDAFDALDAEDRAQFAKGVSGNEEGTTIQRAIARYDYIVGKYYVTGLDTTLISSDFMNRTPNAIAGAQAAPVIAGFSSPDALVICVLLSTAMVSAGGLLVVYRKRRQADE